MKKYKIEGKVNTEMSLEQATYLNMLVERDTPMPMRMEEFESEGKKWESYRCPSCDKRISKDDVFCKSCGQRIDVENIAF